jgi:EAL and modified HD-GYP domain-containing signal transduction protein
MLNRFFKLLSARLHRKVSSDLERSVLNIQTKPVLNKSNEFSKTNNLGSDPLPLPAIDEAVDNEIAIPSSIVCREAILNKTQKVSGYSFGLTHSVKARASKSNELIKSLYDDALLGNIYRMNIQRLQGHRLVFIPILPSSLERAPIEQLPSEGVVLVITALVELINQSSKYLARLKLLKNAGFRIGLQGDVLQPGLQEFLDLSEFVFIDVGGNDLPSIKSQIDTINKQAMSKDIVATNIRLLDEFHVCSKLPFHYFQGSFVTSRETWTSSAMDEGRVKILRLLNLIRQEAENSELIQSFKLDPTLSFKLLRCVNAAGLGFATKINSIDQALLVTGRQNLYRWLTLLLFTSSNGISLDLALMENALIRARLAELCASSSFTKIECDELFVAGIFSMLDILLQMPMEKLLKQVSLPFLVEEALLQKSGKYTPYLELSIACEELDQHRIVSLSNQIGLDLAQITALQTEALIWADMINH